MLEQFFIDMEQWPISKAIGESLWIYPLDQALHLVGMAFLMGAVMIINLRLLGIGITNTSLAQVARNARPWFIGGMIFMVMTGLPQLMQNASREYYSEYFWRKMYFLAASLIVTAISIRYMTKQSDSARTTAGSKLAGAVSLLLWVNVIIPARLIGLFT
jgi:hypothetical protein